PPRTENLRIVVRMTLPDGRAFETDKDIKVRLLPGAASRPETMLPAVTPLFKSAPACPAPVAGIRPASHWEGEPLHKAVQLGRPTASQRPASLTEIPYDLLPQLGDVRLEE